MALICSDADKVSKSNRNEVIFFKLPILFGNFLILLPLRSLYRTIFFKPLNAIKKQAVIANGVQRNEAICPVLAGFLLKTGQIASSCLLAMTALLGKLEAKKNSTVQ